MFRFGNTAFTLCLALVALIPAAGQSPQPENVVARLSASDNLLQIHLPRLSSSAAVAAAAPVSSAPSPLSSRPASLFDAVANPFGPVSTTVKVDAYDWPLDIGLTEPHRAGGEDVLTSAGTYGDISRYLQIFPGVVASSDLSNQMLVRGGHPMENLFLVDGIEIPNINLLANANTTGGFGPMIDAAAIQSLQFYTGGFDANYPERLSSVTEFHTLDPVNASRHAEVDFGIQGVGGLAERDLRGGNLLVSAHHGLVNLVSQNVGINGVPSYTNELTRYRKRSASGGMLTLLHVGGIDSISMTPCASDTAETSTINSKYQGWRETTGAEWRHVFSGHSFGALNVSDSEQVEHIHQEEQILNPLLATNPSGTCPLPNNLVQATPVYREDSNNAFTTAKYNFGYGQSRMTVTAGSAFWLQRPQFLVDQPEGSLSPYLETMVRADSTSFRSNFATGESGTYSQMLVHPTKGLSLTAGGRLQTFAFGDHLTVTPRLGASYSLGERSSIHAAYAGYAQMPPYAYMLAYPANRMLAPMRVTHQIVGMDFGFVPGSRVRVEAYNKIYRSIPASTEYTAVTLETMVDMLGEQYVWLPMTTGGRGTASGVELSDRMQIGSRCQIQGSVAYSRAHTPFNLNASLAQNRAIYDLTQLNVPRAPYYSRLDAQVNKEFRIRSLFLELYCGVDNILNRSNFLSYAWMPRYRQRDSVGTLWQTPIFPNLGVRLILR